jgi:hypothetical protein
VRAETFFANQRPAAGLSALDAASVPLVADSSRDTLAVYGSRRRVTRGRHALRAGTPSRPGPRANQRTAPARAVPATWLPLPRHPASPPRPLPHLDPQSRRPPVTKTLTTEDAERLRPYFAAHRRLRQLITELEAVSIELAEQPATAKTPGDQPP